MVDRITVLSEPELEFRYGQRITEPHSGLSLFGPYDSDLPAHPRGISYGIIGTEEGLALFDAWSAALQNPIVVPYQSKRNASQTPTELQELKHRLLWPAYPGFEAAFQCAWNRDAAWAKTVDRETLIQNSLNRDPNQRAFDVVLPYYEAMRIVSERHESIQLVICVVPEEVFKNCRPKSVIKGGFGKALSAKTRAQRRAQGDLFEPFNAEQYLLSPDFRRQLKARCLDFGVPVQILRESTMKLGPRTPTDRDVSPDSDRAWNLSTALYYKAGGKPWRLSTARDGVCYIGVAFRRYGDSEESTTACCAAQMFLDTGDGIVFRGDRGPWYSPENEQCHLDQSSASRMLEGVLKAYEDQGGQTLKEIFLHCRSEINDDEFNGYTAACPPGVKLVVVRIRTEDGGVKMFRPGEWPVMRGTFWKVSERCGYLWAAGFKPVLLSYDGWETPNPLRIDILRGEADVEQVARDILGLTKLNFNACRLGDSEPVTIKFADAVGEILVSNPAITKPSPNFKHYI